MKKKKLFLVIMMMAAFLLPIYVHAEGTYTITFNSNGGSEVAPQQIENWSQLSYATIPEREGYEFLGWYRCEDLISCQEIKEENYPLTSNMTLYAKWISKDNIIHEMNITVAKPIVGSKIEEIQEFMPSDEGSEFDGAYENFNSQISSPNPTVTIPSNANYEVSSHYYVAELGLQKLKAFTGTIEENQNYIVHMSIRPKDGYILGGDCDTNITINGVNLQDAINKEEATYEISQYYINIEIKVPSEAYTILEGENQTYESGKDLTIKANGDLSKFQKLLIDGKEVAEDNYTKESGSTIITLKNSYLATLSEGTHEVTLVYNDGEVKTNITIKDGNPKTANNIFLYLIISMMCIIVIGMPIIMKKKSFNV